MLVGGAPSRRVFAHVAEFGQGWGPVGGQGLTDAVPRLREQVVAAGRSPEGLETIPFTTAEANHGKIDAPELAGATEIAFDVRPVGRADGAWRAGLPSRVRGRADVTSPLYLRKWLSRLTRGRSSYEPDPL